MRLVELFSPEHGIRVTEDRTNLASGIDERSGLVIHSLYTGAAIALPDSTLRGLDALVVDPQDIGTRTWPYVGSILYAMRTAARNHMPIIVLDGPNPLGGVAMIRSRIRRSTRPHLRAARTHYTRRHSGTE
jgi:uncharacterized protein YbbC (DUF1343 family)